MEEVKKVSVELDEIDLIIITTALASSQPINKELETSQFRLYYRLLFKLNEIK
jgi:hypothetical protein